MGRIVIIQKKSGYNQVTQSRLKKKENFNVLQNKRRIKRLVAYSIPPGNT